jgi:mannan endo-1,4-beta-mannosidase
MESTTSRAVLLLSAVSFILALAAIAGCDSIDDAGALPIAADDSATTDRDTPVSLSLIANDVAVAPAALDVRSVDLDPARPGPQQYLMTSAGDYFLDCLGGVRFTPASGFSGDASAEYTVADDRGRLAEPGRIVITVRD